MSRACLLLTAAAWFGFALAAGPALAESDGLPQLDTGLFPEQLFWLAITFALLYLLMNFIALPSVRRTQDQRAATIKGELTAAQDANEAAKAMLAQYEKALADARAEAQATVSAIAAEAAKQSAAKQAEQHERLAKRLSDTEAKIAAARDSSVKQIRETAVDLASAIVEKIIRAKLSSIS